MIRRNCFDGNTKRGSCVQDRFFAQHECDVLQKSNGSKDQNACLNYYSNRAYLFAECIRPAFFNQSLHQIFCCDVITYDE